MKTYTIQILVSILLTLYGCKSGYVPYSVNFGEFNFYYSTDKKEKDELTLKADNTFFLILSGRYVNPSCSGHWSFVDKNTILLECGVQNSPTESLGFDYIAKRIQLIKVIDSNTLKMPVTNRGEKKFILLKREI